MRTLSEALQSFKWPAEDTPFANARLVTPDPALSGRAEGEVVPWRDAERYYKFFTRGTDEHDPLSLVEPGDYSFSLSLGGRSETVSVTAGDNWTNGELMQAVADGVNNASLPVQAEVIRQNSPGLRVADQVATGMSLGLAVNGAYDEQDLSLRDTSGHLLQALDLRQTRAPVGPAQEHRYALQGLSRYQPSTFHSDSFDPNAATTIAPGSYDFGWALGPDSGEFSLDIASGDSWEDVLNRFGNALTSATSAATAEVYDISRPSDLVTDDYLLMDGKALSISAANPKLGERLTLSASGDTDADVAAARTALETLGLHVTAHPGADGSMRVDGTEQTRAPGVFTQDRGRLQITQDDIFGETLPLRVVDAMETLEQGVEDIVDGYNSIRRIVILNEDLFRSGMADQWQDPVQDREVALGNIGLEAFGTDQLLWANADDFFSALGRDAQGVRTTLLGDDSDAADKGLFGDWQTLADELLEQGAEAYLVNPSEVETNSLRPPTPRTEVQLDKGYSLVEELVQGSADGLESMLPDPFSGKIVDETG